MNSDDGVNDNHGDAEENDDDHWGLLNAGGQKSQVSGTKGPV